MSYQVFVPQEVATLQPFVDAGVLGLTEVNVVASFALASGEVSPEVLLAAALAVRAPLHGHVCVDLSTVTSTVATLADSAPQLSTDGSLDDQPPSADSDGEEQPVPIVESLPWPDPATWLATVAASPLTSDRSHTQQPVPDTGLAPLIIENGLLYLARYQALERYVAQDLLHRSRSAVLGEPSAVDVEQTAADPMSIGLEKLAELLPDIDATSRGAGSQFEAAAAALDRNFVVISGGPGTGKTYTVSRLLAAISSGLVAAGSDLLVALAAPTGKASARMTEAIRQALNPVDAKDALPLSEEVRAHLSEIEATTIHRLLGTGSNGGFRHHPGNPLPHDIVVVDEVSMVSLSLMAHLLAAIRPDAKVIFAGDPYQLASVEAGTVLGDVVGLATGEAAGQEPVPPQQVAPSVRRLGVVRRQQADSGILQLAEAIRECDAERTIEVLRSGGHEGDVRWIAPHDVGERKRIEDDLKALAVEIVNDAVVASELIDNDAQQHAIEAILTKMNSTKVLSALRQGTDGVDGWNRRVDEHLRRKKLCDYSAWYTGRPVMVTENDYLNEVFNGDVGVALSTGDRFQVWFPRTGSPKVVEAARLDRVETQWAMSIHKSQGSEFPHVVVTLPPPPSRILTRELLYTAVTRAKERVTVVASEESIVAAVTRPIARASGLAARLSGN